jgi:hypothetical protein
MPTDASGYHRIQRPGAAVCVEELHIQLCPFKKLPLCRLCPRIGAATRRCSGFALPPARVRLRPSDRATASSLSMISSNFLGI